MSWLDRDYNRQKVDKLLAEHKEIAVDVAGPPYWLLRSTSPSPASSWVGIHKDTVLQTRVLFVLFANIY